VTLFRGRYRIETARHPQWDYSARGWYFVTFCTRNRVCYLGDVVDQKALLSRAGLIAEEKIRELSRHYPNVSIDCFVIMPNHVHAIIALEGQHSLSPATADGAGPVSTARYSTKLGDVVGGFKASVSRECNANGILDFAWQERFMTAFCAQTYPLVPCATT
jgi:putative transposase